MIDLSSEAAALEAALGPPFRPGVGRVVQFVSAERGEGTSTVAREFARHLCQKSRRGVWLVELDLMRGDQYASIAADPEHYGFLGPSVRATPDNSMFFKVQPGQKGVDGRAWPDARYLAAYPIGGRRWWVTRFRREALKPGQSAHIQGSPDYWDALRRHADWIVVDCPAAERSRAVLATAAHMDSNVLVVAAESGDSERPPALRDAIVHAGGVVSGVFLNQVRTEPAPFMRLRGT
jgi:hypothetical protein